MGTINEEMRRVVEEQRLGYAARYRFKGTGMCSRRETLCRLRDAALRAVLDRIQLRQFELVMLYKERSAVR